MPRAMWKGSIAFGLVTVPVSLYVADLAEALRKSLEEGRRPAAKMNGRRPARARRTGGRHRKAA